IQRTNTDFAPGPPGLKAVQAPAEIASGIDLENISTAEPGVRVGPDGQARYQDSRRTPAVIMKQQGKGKTVYLNLLMTNYYLQRTESTAGEGLRRLIAAQYSRRPEFPGPMALRAPMASQLPVGRCIHGAAA